MAGKIIHLIQIVPGDRNTHTVCGVTGTRSATSRITEANCPVCLQSEATMHHTMSLLAHRRMWELGCSPMQLKEHEERKKKGGLVDAAG